MRERERANIYLLEPYRRLSILFYLRRRDSGTVSQAISFAPAKFSCCSPSLSFLAFQYFLTIQTKNKEKMSETRKMSHNVKTTCLLFGVHTQRIINFSSRACEHRRESLLFLPPLFSRFLLLLVGVRANISLKRNSRRFLRRIPRPLLR